MRRMMQQRRRETGVVSIMVTLVMMIVITLIVLGFAEIARNEQRSSLDDQLSAQAYYAAESGINDARVVINAAVAANKPVNSKTVCADQNGYNFNLSLQDQVDPAHNVAYTCVLIDPSPATLTYNIGYASTVIPLHSTGPAFGTLALTWTVPSASAAGCYTALASLNVNPVASGMGAWGCNYPIVRIDLLDANGALSRANWTGNTATMFLVPFNSNSVANNVTMAARGTAVPARCGNINCAANIVGLIGTNYYMRVTTLYQTNSLFTVSSPGGKFSGAQATIDVTGKAQDVLRRVLIAADLTGANRYTAPSAAIMSEDSICKRFGITNHSFAVYDDLSAGGGGNPLCTLQSVGSPTNP